MSVRKSPHIHGQASTINLEKETSARWFSCMNLSLCRLRHKSCREHCVYSVRRGSTMTSGNGCKCGLNPFVYLSLISSRFTTTPVCLDQGKVGVSVPCRHQCPRCGTSLSVTLSRASTDRLRDLGSVFKSSLQLWSWLNMMLELQRVQRLNKVNA